jgi:hypothetical protein
VPSPRRSWHEPGLGKRLGKLAGALGDAPFQLVVRVLQRCLGVLALGDIDEGDHRAGDPRRLREVEDAARIEFWDGVLSAIEHARPTEKSLFAATG